MTDYWKKTLSDNSVEVGTDQDILAKKASWTRGRQDILSVELWFNGHQVTLSSSCLSSLNWKQVDQYIASFQNHGSKRVAREIGCPTEDMKYFHVSYDKDSSLKTTVHITLNNTIGTKIPDNTEFIICKIFPNGQIQISFEVPVDFIHI